MTDDEIDEAVWDRLRTLLPSCTCGEQLRPGGSDGIGPVLVCLSCSSVAEVDSAYAESLAAKARSLVEAEMS